MIANLSGRRFGRLTVVSLAKRGYRNRPIWECRCECGAVTYVYGDNLKRGNTTSCGCYQAQVTRARSIIHGDAPRNRKSKEYLAWASAKNRVVNPKHQRFAYYGGRGIQMCREWLESFQCFLQDMGRCPDDKRSIDRIDNNGNYDPSNCRWATHSEQMRNTRRNKQLTA